MMAIRTGDSWDVAAVTIGQVDSWTVTVVQDVEALWAAMVIIITMAALVADTVATGIVVSVVLVAIGMAALAAIVVASEAHVTAVLAEATGMVVSAEATTVDKSEKPIPLG